MNDTYEDKFYSINVMKIKSGIDVMINWWKSIPDNYRPENLIFLLIHQLNLIMITLQKIKICLISYLKI